MILNESFREALHEVTKAHEDIVRHLSRLDWETGDPSDETNYCKAIAVLTADNLGNIMGLHQKFYSLDERIQVGLLEQINWRMSSIDFIATKNRGNTIIESVFGYIQNAVACMNYAKNLYDNNPQDFSALDRGLNALKNINVSKEENI